MILIDKTFDEVTPESAEDGDTSDSGFIVENEPMTFRELVNELRGYPFASTARVTGSSYEWASTEPETDYRTGAEYQESIHYSYNNAPRAAKYWRKAMRYVFAKVVK